MSPQSEDDALWAAVADPTRRRMLDVLLYAVRPERLDDATQRMAELAAEWDERLNAIKRLAEAAQRR